MQLVLSLLGFVIVVLASAFVAFLLVRKRQRHNLNLRRGLSMVLLRIHLPPVSEDVDTKSRDGREVIDENLSKATALYNLLASVAEKKGFKTSYYGQEHVGFEIIAKGSSVHFYAAAPESLVPIVRQAITSTYKSARVEEAEEHNLFDPEIASESVAGGHLILKEHYAYPIATYVESRQDIMKSLLGSLSDLGERDGAGIQILLRPAGEQWTKAAQDVAKAKSSKGGSSKDSFLKDLLVSPFKPPDSKSSEKKDTPEISGLDKNLIEAIEKKITQPGFEVLIRLIASTPKLQHSRDIYNNLFSAFALLDAPKSNGFKQRPAKNVAGFASDFNLRLFPQQTKENVLNSIELATIFHLPDEANIPTSQVERQQSKQVDGPRNFLKDGLLLGHNVFRGNRREVLLGAEDRMRHMYVVGQTGTGKSVFLENLVLQDVQAGRGFAFVDPHGETAERVIARISPEQADKVIYFHPGNMEFPMGLNIFEHDNPDQQDFLIQEAITMLYKLYDPHQQGIMGPRYEHIFRNAAKLVMADPAGGTFIDIPKLFVDRQFVEQKLRHVSDQTVIDFWRKEIVDSAKSNEFGDLKNWFLAKFSAFLSNTMMRNILGQNKSAFDLRQVMDEGKMMVINLSLGQTGELNMKLLGMLFVIKFQMAAMSRADISEEQRPDFTLYIDEFQNFATDSFANILSAARKYHLALIVANQHTSQLTEEIRDSVYGNVGTAIAFRINAQDAENMIKQFYSPTFEIDDLTRLPLAHTVVRTLIEGAPTVPFNMMTLPPSKVRDMSARKAFEKRLLQKYGRPRKEVEKEISERLAVQAPPPGPPPGRDAPFPRSLPPHMMPPPGMGVGPGSGLGPLRPPSGPMPPMPSSGGRSKQPPLPPGGSSSFVEDWLKRRQALQEELLAKRQKLEEGLAQQKVLQEKLENKREELQKRLSEKNRQEADASENQAEVQKRERPKSSASKPKP